MIKNKLTLLFMLTLTSCLASPSHEKTRLSTALNCKLKKYCAATEGSILKSTLKAALETQIKGNLPDLCNKYQEPWGYDYTQEQDKLCQHKTKGIE